LAVGRKADEEEEERRRTLQSNLGWIDTYVAWIRRTPNREWSREQRRMIDSVLRSARKWARMQEEE